MHLVGFITAKSLGICSSLSMTYQVSYLYDTYYRRNYNSLQFRLRGTAVSQWLRCCATNRKVAGSIPIGVSGFFIDIKSSRSYNGPGVDSASKRNEYREYFLG